MLNLKLVSHKFFMIKCPLFSMSKIFFNFLNDFFLAFCAKFVPNLQIKKVKKLFEK